MFRISNVLGRHVGAVALSACVGLVFVSQHIFLAQAVGESGTERVYQPVTYRATFDEAAGYAPRMHAVAGGDTIAGDVSLSEYGTGGPSVLPLLNPVILGVMEYLFGSLKNAIIAASFFFPALIFLGLYLIVYEVLHSRYVALLAALVFVFIPDINNYIQLPKPQALLDIFHRFFPFFDDDVSPLYFLKFEYPLVTFPFYLASLYTLVRALARSERTTVWLAGIMFGLLFYTYFYDWTYLLATLGILALFFLVRSEYGQLKKIGIIAGTGIAVSVPYWVNFAALSALPAYDDIVSRIGVELSHEPRLSIWKNYLRTLIVAGGLLVFAYRYQKTKVVCLIGLLLASFAVFNAHVVTGFAPQPDHWYRLQFLPMALGELVVIYFLLRRYAAVQLPRIVHRVFFAGVVILMLSGGLYSTYAFSRAYGGLYALDRSLLEGYAWLNENTPERSVVGTLSLPENSALLVHTHNRVFLPFGLNTYASNSEIWDRWMILASLFGVTPEVFARDFAAAIPGTSGFHYNKYLFHNAYADTSLDAYNGYVKSSLSREIPPEVQDDMNRIYLRYYELAGEIPYRLDYILVLKEKETALRSDIKSELKFENTSMKIYAL